MFSNPGFKYNFFANNIIKASAKDMMQKELGLEIESEANSSATESRNDLIEAPSPKRKNTIHC